MVASNRNFSFSKKGLYLLLLLLLGACQPKELVLELSKTDILTGQVQLEKPPPEPKLATQQILRDGPSENSGSCAFEKVQLFKINSEGIDDKLVAEASVDASGFYKFEGLRGLGLELTSGLQEHVNYSIKLRCGEQVLQRYVTGTVSQNVSQGTTLLKWLSQTEVANQVRSVGAKDWQELYASLEDIPSMTEAFSRIDSDESLKEKFRDLFNVDPELLKEAYPTIQSINVPLNFEEEQGQSLVVKATHWSKDYPIAYAWKIGNREIGKSSNLIFTPSANSQGQFSVQLFVGQDDGAGNINTNKPYLQRTFETTIKDSVPAQPPAVSLLSPALTKSSIVQIRMTTGSQTDGRPKECRSFSKLALIVDLEPSVAVPPILPTSYTLDCESATVQDFSVELLPVNGGQVLRLWAMDAAGGISTLPTELHVQLDTIPPQNRLLSFDGGLLYKGGETYEISYAVKDANLSAEAVSIEYSADEGLSWQTIATHKPASGVVTWKVPSINSTKVKVRLSAVDLAGNVGTVTSASYFTIDSTPPLKPLVTRLSSAITNDRSMQLSLLCDSDFSQIWIGESGSIPALSDANWKTCSSAMTYFVSAGDGSKEIFIRARDQAGNISDSSSINLILDQTPPDVSWTTYPTGEIRGGTVVPLKWKVTEVNMTTAQSMNLSYSGDGGTTWVSISNPAASNGPLFETQFSFDWSAPPINSNKVRLRVLVEDVAGNTIIAQLSNQFTIDSLSPTIALFQLAGGNPLVAMPTVSVTISASDNFTNVTSMRLSESETFVDGGWLPFSSSGSNFTLSATNGTKSVYLWLKDGVGNVSASTVTTIGLDFGTPPKVSVNTPVATDIYSPGQTVPISWSCSSNNGLSSTPISLAYSVDDGLNFKMIASDLANNLSANTGSYEWTLPPSVSVFRILVQCKSAAGVISSTYSAIINTPGWSLFAGDPWYGLTNVSALIANVGGSSRSSITADKNNNIYFVKGQAIMRIDAQTGFVTTFAGDQAIAGCTMSQGKSPSGANGLMTNPRILGGPSDRSGLFVYSCSKIFFVDTGSSTVSLWAAPVPAPGSVSFFARNRKLIYLANDYKYYSLDLATQGNIPIWIHGDGTCIGSQPTVGMDARTSPIQKNAAASTSCSNYDGIIMANEDTSKIWINMYYTFKAYRLDWNGSHYIIGHADLGSNWTEKQNCISTDFDLSIYCSPRYMGRTIYRFEPSTGNWGSQFNVAFEDNYSAAYLGIGSLSDKLLSHFSANQINTIKPNLSSNWESTIIAGLPLATMGNGNQIGAVGFDTPLDIKYNTTTKSLWVRNATGHLRKVDLGVLPIVTSTVYDPKGGWSGAIGSANVPLAVNSTGTQFALHQGCGFDGMAHFNLGQTSLSALSPILGTDSCGQGVVSVYPTADGTAAQTLNLPGGKIPSYQTPLLHSNGKTYYAAMNGANDVFVFSSDKTTIRRVAGATGGGGYFAAENGTVALGAHLKRVDQLIEVQAGNNSGDILIWDENRLRLLTVKSDSVSPKIHDILDFNLVTGYSPGTLFGDVFYDQTTECNGILGTGTIYYSNSQNEVHKMVPTCDKTGGTDTKYDFTGTSFSGTVRLTMIPGALLILQPNKSRVLKVAP